jgi:hypothetical protein
VFLLTLPFVFHMLSELHEHGQPLPAPGPAIAVNFSHSAQKSKPIRPVCLLCSEGHSDYVMLLL